jgi:predicted DNA-binding transcriptional regulator YafY
MENLVTWILTFGEKAEILEPKQARKRLTEIVRNMNDVYKEDEK